MRMGLFLARIPVPNGMSFLRSSSERDIMGTERVARYREFIREGSNII